MFGNDQKQGCGFFDSCSGHTFRTPVKNKFSLYMQTQTAQNGTKADHDEIAARAYQIWEASGRPPGSEMKHWLQAEEELARKTSPAPAKPAQLAAEQTGERREPQAAKVQTNKRPGASVRAPLQGAQKGAVAA